jgi:hypothetical protein
MWRLTGQPKRAQNGPDDHRWLYELTNENGDTVRVEFREAGTLAATAPSTLPKRVAEAKQTRGLSEIERVLSYRYPPNVIEAGTLRITLLYMNGLTSRVGGEPAKPPTMDEMLASQQIRVELRKKVEYIYDFTGDGWKKTSLENGKAGKDPERLMFLDVYGELKGDDRQRALDLDPKGAASLSVKSLAAKP